MPLKSNTINLAGYLDYPCRKNNNIREYMYSFNDVQEGQKDKIWRGSTS